MLCDTEKSLYGIQREKIDNLAGRRNPDIMIGVNLKIT